MRLMQLKNAAASPGFLTTKYLGEVVKEKGGIIEIKNACIVYEAINQDRFGNMDIATKYFTSSGITNGILKLKEEDISVSREVSEDDEFLSGYREALERFRLSKLNIQKAGQQPTPPQIGRA